jgi:hypothetical protein
MAGPSLRLDRSRDYATVHGETEVPIHAFQDGLPFGPDGELVESALSDEQKAIVERKLARIRASKPKVKDAGSEPNPAGPPGAGQSNAPGINDAINFESWLRGLERHTPQALFAEARARWSRSFSNLTDLVEFLVYDQKVIAADEVSPDILPRGNEP